jgi:hypothetical protein
MQVIGKDGIFQDIDSIDGGEGFETLPDPFPSMGVVFPGEFIDSGEKGSADTAMGAVDDTDFVVDELLATGRAGHGGFLQVSG